MKPFTIHIADDAIADLRERLRGWRQPVGVIDSGGVPLDEMNSLIAYWRDEFDWRAHERALNELPQFLADVDGVPLHFVHVKTARTNATPLLILHGWPGSFIEMRKIIPLLSEKFDVIVPSLPGYGFSPLGGSGFSNRRVAEVMADLMTLLGYSRFAVQGGDWGAGIATWLALAHPSRLIGMHLNYIPGSYAPFVAGDMTEEEASFVKVRDRWIAESGAYGHVQRTRPLTLAYGLSDSPAGLAAWIYEKFVEWSDPDTRPVIDDILANISLYWFTNTIGSSMRMYLESSKTLLQLAGNTRIETPAAIFRCRHEAPFPPRRWVERGYNVKRWTECDRGGHFAAMETPVELAADIAAFFKA